jgi:hypothetical protein
MFVRSETRSASSAGDESGHEVRPGDRLRGATGACGGTRRARCCPFAAGLAPALVRVVRRVVRVGSLKMIIKTQFRNRAEKVLASNVRDMTKLPRPDRRWQYDLISSRMTHPVPTSSRCAISPAIRRASAGSPTSHRWPNSGVCSSVAGQLRQSPNWGGTLNVAPSSSQ